MNNLFTHDSSRVAALGVGTLGCLAAKFAVENSDSRGLKWSAAHVNSAELIATGAEQKLFLKCNGQNNLRAFSRCIDESAIPIERIVRGREAVVLCGELCDAVSTLMIEALAPGLFERGIKVFGLLQEPFSPNGEVDVAALEAARERLEARLPFVALLNAGLEDMAGVSARRIQKLAAERLVGAAECFANGIEVNQENAAQTNVLRGRCSAIYSRCQGPGVVIGAIDKALAAVDEESRKSIDAVMLQSAAEVSFREVNAIKRKLSEVAADAELIIGTRPELIGRAECLLLCGRPKAENVVSIEAAFGARL